MNAKIKGCVICHNKPLFGRECLLNDKLLHDYRLPNVYDPTLLLHATSSELKVNLIVKKIYELRNSVNNI